MAVPYYVDTYHDLICYQYARLIGEAAGIDDDGFIRHKFNKLESGEMEMSSINKEDKYQLKEGFGECIYCGKECDTTFDHLIPVSEGGPDKVSNQVPACKSCNSEKNDRNVIDWYSEQDEDVPRIVWGKYLKLIRSRLREDDSLHDPLPDDVRERWDGVGVTRNVSKRIRKRYR